MTSTAASEHAGELRAGGSTQASRRATIAASIGNVLEWYDFGIYGFFAATIGAKFFAAGDAVSGLLSAFAVFGIGFFARPLGGIVIGFVADKYGRRPALMITIMLMALGTLMIGISPTYESVGVLAPIILVTARLLQGFSTGGEWGASAAFVVEWATPGRRGLYASAQQLTAYLGIVVGSSVAAIVSGALSAPAIDSWGWRIPFLLGALIGPFGLYMRRTISETPAFTAATKISEEGQPTQWGPAFRLFCLVALSSSATFTFMYYLPSFTQRYSGVTRTESLWANSIAIMAFVFAVPVAGMISDRIGRKPLLVTGALLFLVCSYPLMAATTLYPGFASVLAVQIILDLFFAIYAGAAAVTCVELFPTKTRLRWLSPAYNVAQIAFGAFAPYIATWLVSTTGSPTAVVYFVVLTALISGVAALSMRETAHEPLR